MQTQRKALRRGGLLVMLGAWLTFSACDEVDRLIRADNPGAIPEEDLDDPALVEVLLNSANGALMDMYDDYVIWRGSMLTDEQVTGINWEGTARINLRVVRFDGEGSDMFENVSAYRFMGDSVSSRLRTLLEEPQSDRSLALALAHSGYGKTLMGEVMCEATIDVGPDIYGPEELGDLAIPSFEEAITIAEAADDEDVANLARVGLARAALLAGDQAKVMAAAEAVSDTDFSWWVEYEEGTADNVMSTRVTGGNHALGVHPRFLNGEFGVQGIVETQTDPRIQHTKESSRGHNQLTPLYKPYMSLPYDGYNGEIIADGGEPELYTLSTNITLASYVEAMHHYYEAAGPDGNGPEGSTLEFVNARRGFGNQEPVDLSGEALMSELREQRARDLYLGGFRLGDLRRYERNGIDDPMHVFPTGLHVNPDPPWGGYQDGTCFPLPLEEYLGNPNIQR